jgi:hypothetical protein
MRAILLGEEISVGEGAGVEADEAINLLLTAAEGVEETLSFEGHGIEPPCPLC